MQAQLHQSCILKSSFCINKPWTNQCKQSYFQDNIPPKLVQKSSNDIQELTSICFEWSNLLQVQQAPTSNSTNQLCLSSSDFIFLLFFFLFAPFSLRLPPPPPTPSCQLNKSTIKYHVPFTNQLLSKHFYLSFSLLHWSTFNFL